MANNIPFQPMGKTYTANVTATSQEIAINADSPCNQLRIHNDGQLNSFIRFSSASGNAAGVPVVGTPAYGFAMHPGTVEIFTVPQAFNSNTSTLYVSVISSGTGNQVWITPGEGL
jgi:hypothetical protein